MDEIRVAVETLLTTFGRCADRGDGEALYLLFYPPACSTLTRRSPRGR